NPADLPILLFQFRNQFTELDVALVNREFVNLDDSIDVAQEVGIVLERPGGKEVFKPIAKRRGLLAKPIAGFYFARAKVFKKMVIARTLAAHAGKKIVQLAFLFE